MRRLPVLRPAVARAIVLGLLVVEWVATLAEYFLIDTLAVEEAIRTAHARAASWAYESCVTHIESNCLGYTKDGFEWWDTAIAVDDLGHDPVLEAVAYLDHRGLIVRDATQPTWVQVRDE